MTMQMSCGNFKSVERKSQHFYHLVCFVLFRTDAGGDFSTCCHQDCLLLPCVERDQGE